MITMRRGVTPLSLSGRGELSTDLAELQLATVVIEQSVGGHGNGPVDVRDLVQCHPPTERQRGLGLERDLPAYEGAKVRHGVRERRRGGECLRDPGAGHLDK